MISTFSPRAFQDRRQCGTQELFCDIEGREEERGFQHTFTPLSTACIIPLTNMIMRMDVLTGDLTKGHIQFTVSTVCPSLTQLAHFPLLLSIFQTVVAENGLAMQDHR